MDAWAIAGIILGSSVLCEVIKLVLDRLKRKDTVNDRKDKTADQVEELRTETSEQFAQMDKRIVSVEQKIDTVGNTINALMLNGKAQSYDRIRHLGMVYIKAGEIGEGELRNLIEMYDAYKELGGDGFLDRVMEEVYRLRIKPDD